MTFSKRIERLVSDDVVIQRGLARGILSLRATARYLQPSVPEASIDAIVSALRRIEPVIEEKPYLKAREVIARSADIRTTTGIIEFSLRKTSRSSEVIDSLVNEVDIESGGLLLIIQGEQSIKLITNASRADLVREHTPQELIMHVEQNLAQLNIQLDDDAVRTPGIINVFTTELLLHKINIFESMSCVPEMLFFVRERDVVDAYQVLFNLMRS